MEKSLQQANDELWQLIMEAQQRKKKKAYIAKKKKQQ